MTSYRAVRYGDAAKENYPLPRYEASWKDALRWDGEWTSGIWRFENGIAVEFVGCDGGEPEDQTLTRDWAWVTEALNAAHKRGHDLGYNHGYDEGFNDGQSGA